MRKRRRELRFISKDIHTCVLLPPGEALSCGHTRGAGEDICVTPGLAAVMDMRDRRQRSLGRGSFRNDLHYATSASTLDVDECCVASTQKAYSTSASGTLKAYEHESHLRYGGCVTELVHHEREEYVRQGESSTPTSSLSGSQIFFLLFSLFLTCGGSHSRSQGGLIF